MATVNPWRRFIGLLPGGARTVGEVIDVDEGRLRPFCDRRSATGNARLPASIQPDWPLLVRSELTLRRRA